MVTRERRAFPISELRASASVDGKMPMIVGHAAVFNKPSENLGYFREKIMPGPLKDSIGTDDVRALFNHDPMYVLGRNIGPDAQNDRGCPGAGRRYRAARHAVGARSHYFNTARRYFSNVFRLRYS